MSKHDPEFDIIREAVWAVNGKPRQCIVEEHLVVALHRWRCDVCQKGCQGLEKHLWQEFEDAECIRPAFCSDACAQRYLDEKLYT